MKRFKRGNQGGAVMIEFAIALPLLMLMISGVANLGSMLWQIQQFSDAARHGARIAANRSNDAPARSCSNLGDPNSLAYIARQASMNYINGNNLDNMGWWDDPIPSIVSVSWSDGATRFPQSGAANYIKVRIQTSATTTNCVLCYGNMLSYLNVGVESLFLVEGACV